MSQEKYNTLMGELVDVLTKVETEPKTEIEMKCEILEGLLRVMKEKRHWFKKRLYLVYEPFSSFSSRNYVVFPEKFKSRYKVAKEVVDKLQPIFSLIRDDYGVYIQLMRNI